MSSKALFIVEGIRREKDFFLRIQEAFHLDMEIVPFCGNIPMLYDEMARTEFLSDVRKLLLAKTTDSGQREVLQATYSDIYMIFDLDPQHGVVQQEGESVEAALRRNAECVFGKALEMASRLNNSTDPTLGKLYINYPSIESFRDADDFFDPQYSSRFVSLGELCRQFGGCGYKSISSRGRLAQGKHLSGYSERDFSRLATMNVYKLKRVVDGLWDALPYEEFRMKSDQSFVLRKQREIVRSDLSLGVLNTSLFFLFDYKGEAYYNQSVAEVGR